MKRIVSDAGDVIGSAVVGDFVGDGDSAFVGGRARVSIIISPRVCYAGSLCVSIKVVIDAVNLCAFSPRAKGEESGGEGGE